MNKMNWKWILAFAAALVGMAVLLDSLAWAGKPQPPTPPPPKPLPPVKYNITWLYATIAGNFSDMNDFGDVVGNCVGLDGRRQAFVYTSATGPVPLNSLVDPDGPNGDVRLNDAQGINNWGQIVGEGSRNGSQFAYRFTPGFFDDEGTWVPSVVELLPLPPGTDFAYPWGINDDGEVVVAATMAFTYGVFVYDKTSSWVDTGATPHSNGNRLDINNQTQVAGMHSPQTYEYHAFRWSLNGGLELFGDLGGSTKYGSWSHANAINDLGQFVGQANADGAGRAFRYTDGVGMVNLGTLGQRSEAFGINNLGQVVGTFDTFVKVQGLYRVAHTYGFLYTDASGMVNLDNLVSGSPEDLATWFSAGTVFASKINTPRLPDGTEDPNGFGQICGTAHFTDAAGNSYSDAFLLTPEPSGM